MADDSLPLAARPVAGGGWELLSPDVGLYAAPPARGRRLAPGDAAGVLLKLERPFALIVPAGVSGFVASDPPERRHLPVGYGALLMRLEADSAAPEIAPPAGAAAGTAGALLVRSPQAGRFWLRPAPDAAPFVEAGAALHEGRTLGLLEVMKTFNPVKYAAGGGLPARARLARFLVADGDDVAEGQPLAELES